MANKPRITSYRRVNSILLNDPALKLKINTQDLVSVSRTNGPSEQFPRKIVEITNEMHKNNLRIATMRIGEMLSFAAHYLSDSAAVTAGDLNESEVSKGETIEGEVIDQTISAHSEPSEEDSYDEPGIKQPSKNEIVSNMEVRNGIPYVPGVAIMSNQYAAVQLMEPFMKNNAAVEAIIKKQNELIDEIRKITVIPHA